VSPRPATTASGWFRRFVEFVQRKSRENAIFLDRSSDFADLWENFEDVGLTRAESVEMKEVLQNAGVMEQTGAWAVLESSPSLFGLTATRFKWQIAQKGRFPAFEHWETLAPFRSVQDGRFEYVSVYAVAVETTRQGQSVPAPSQRGEVFRLAAIVAPSSGGKPRVEWNFEVSDTATSEALRNEVRQQAWQWFGFSCVTLLLEYIFRGDAVFVALPRALRLAFSAWGIRRRLAASDVYFVAGPSLRTPVTGQSVVAPAFAALLLSLFRSSGLTDLWMRVFPRLDNAAFSGRVDKWKEIPIDAVETKIETLRRSGRKIRWAFFARPSDDVSSEDTLDLKVRFCKSTRAMIRQTMEPRKTFLVANVFSVAMACAGSAWGIQAYWPTPYIASVIGVDSSIDAATFVSGAPLRVRSGRPISVRVGADRSAKDKELLVRSARVGSDGKRKNVLLAAQGGLPVGEIRCGFPGNLATFVYVADDETVRNDVLEIGLWHANRLIAWYPLYLSIVKAGAEP
jgi:hypothetical protein